MNAICGPLFIASSPSADLQSSLESRLRAQMAGRGSPLYALTWKHWDMPSGPPICALRASGRRTSGSGSGGLLGWPTPQCFDAQGGGEPRPLRYKGNAPSEAGNTRNSDARGSYRGDLKDYAGMVALTAGWPTPDASGIETADPERILERRAACKEKHQNGNGFGLNLANAAVVYPTEGWATPRANDGTGAKIPPGREGGMALKSQVTLKVNVVHRGDAPPPEHLLGEPVSHEIIPGETPNGSPAPTGKRGQLNPAFSLWLMGFPAEWASYAPQATRLSRKSAQPSSKPSCKRRA